MSQLMVKVLPCNSCDIGKAAVAVSSEFSPNTLTELNLSIRRDEFNGPKHASPPISPFANAYGQFDAGHPTPLMAIQDPRRLEHLHLRAGEFFETGIKKLQDAVSGWRQLLVEIVLIVR